MVPGGVTEVVWHFAGYLKIINDIARDRTGYDESVFRNPQDDYITPRPSYVSNPDFSPLDSQGLLTPSIGPFEEFNQYRILPIKSLSPPAPKPDPHFNLADRLPQLQFPGASGGGGGGSELKITVQYQDGSDQSQVEIHQYNFMSDDDSLLVGASADDIADIAADLARLTSDSRAVLQQMADNAGELIPNEWLMPKSEAGATEFVKAYDEDLASREGAPGAHSVEPGYYLNGELQTQRPEPPAETPLPDPVPAPDLGNGIGQWAETGANDSWNASLIVDLSESGRSMIVMGDYFKTNAIFQTNSIMDQDDIQMSGGTALPVAEGGNKTDNIADFVQRPGIHAELKATFAGPQWNVDVVDGNYYSVHAIVQMNYLSDNDIVVQKSADTHYELYSGGNEQGNLTALFDGTIQYDLIIVAGAYHGMNVIFQNNILLNNDTVKMLADGSDPSQSVVSGQNELTNTATISSYGDDNFLPMNNNLNSLVTAIQSGSTILDPSYGKFVDGSGGVFNVLYITGDYYDVNAIWQTNIITDVNIVMQFLDPPSADARGDAESQSVTSGKNLLTNDAAIVDVGATNTFVNGEVYGDTILVQANLLPEDDNRVLTGDVQSLVPELIAFIDEGQEEAPAAQPVATTPAYEDPVASVMH